MRELKFRLIRDGKIVGYEYHYQGVLPVGITVSILGDEHHGIYHARVGEALFKSILNHHDFIRHDSKDQFTGLLDRNDMELFEGDVIKKHEGEYMGLTGYVEWCGTCCLGYRTQYIGIGNSELIQVPWDTFEIIGNIHETLLEADNE
ncbi:hypothetical protein LCGC14_2288380 [marine sediment metagenome]|uniref:YopX protein domain-containing protein n=1 Tax=marine sediment metagenome TaxID=412755 RepID=A0A0F9F4G8_9ZZZZ